MLLPPYSHPVTHSLRNQIVGLRHFRYRPRPLKNLRDDLFFKLFTKFRSRHSTDFTSHVRINSGFSPLSTKRRALHRRFIPTRAGKITSLAWARHRRAVHPHSRGENSSIPSRVRRSSGSSPLARGKWAVSERRLAMTGFIPTRAGKMSRQQATDLLAAVHPHSRGENPQPLITTGARVGSSPLARGKYRSNLQQRSWTRFIPTRAGKIRHH